MSEVIARRQLLQRLKEKKLSLTGGTESIPAREPGPAPLSFGQRRLWFIEQLEPGNPRFNILTAVRMKGRLRLDVLLRVWEEIVRRHESLRTTIELRESEPVQIVSPRIHVDIPVLDLAILDETRREHHLHELVQVSTMQPFDLERGPLFRILLARLGEDHFVLYLVMHQIVVDRWSRGLLVQEIVTLYDAFCDGRPSPLPELPIQYADYAVWQRNRLQGETLEKLLGYWRERLARPLPTLDLPTDRPRAAHQRPAGRMQYFLIPQAELEDLKSLGQREGVTLFMILLAAVTALFQRYTAQDDFVLGSPVANRTKKEIEGLIGFFLNMLALRLRPRPEGSFRELLQSAHEVAIGAFDHQDMPFERLVDELGVERDLSRHPLFQVTLVLQNAPIPPLALRDLTLSLIEVDWGTTAFDLALFFWETELWESLGKGLSLTTSCSKDLFEETTITRMVGHLRTLLREVVANPERRVGELPLLAESERRQLLALSTAPASGQPRGDGSIQERFEARVQHAPNAVALDFPDGTLTYEELNRKADSLARRLRGLGVRENEPVGILAGPSWMTSAGILGILKAGGVYLPISLEETERRRELILRDAGARLFLARGPEDPAGVRTLRIDDLLQEAGVDELPRTGAASPVGQAPACLFYTSGSTGMPKGVWVSHQAVLSLVVDNGFLELGPGDRVAQASNVAFDAATFEIWGALLNCGTLVGIGRDALLSPPEIGRELSARGVNALFLPTALFHQVAAEAPGSFSGLRHLLVGGETLDPAFAGRVLSAGAPEHFWHVYGPTENTTFSTFYEVETIPAGSGPLPIGRPLLGREMYVVDDQLSPVPLGVRGEILLGGVGLAQGYLGRPDLTAERFIPHPFASVPGERLFRTGDLGRLLQDGRVEFRGRRDRQVKVRGFRIELGEIEANLRTHPSVLEALVAFRRRDDGSGEIVAGVVCRNGVTPGQIAQYLRAKLPAYMVPSVIARLDSLPLTRHGKIDQDALRSIAVLPERPERAPAAPRNELERQVAGIWSEVLGRGVGVEDDFFELGGHSLDVTQIVSRLKREIGLDVPVRSFFELRTVAGLASSKDVVR
jgi:amino acid adenylation domain-containing protein